MELIVPKNKVLDHRATVRVKDDGSLDFRSSDINPAGRNTTKKKIAPDPSENIVSLKKNKELFANLEFADILLTNACNLSCTYCYEQHNRDFGKFDTKMVRETWDWLRDINDNFPKYIQFFGGEPLIHKNLILAFMKENREELERMKGLMHVSITTNGLLLTKEFIDEFFSYPSVKMMISLDTIDSSVDHRGITPKQMEQLLNNIEYVASKVTDHNNLAIRATITRAGSPQLKTFWEHLYKRGVRQLIFHPMILSLGEGYVEWPEVEWKQFSDDIKDIIRSYPDVEHFQVVEGVGAKSKTNCLVGSDEIAVDPSGDFSGCYFFTNRKDDLSSKMLLGNIFDDDFYIDRYNGFRDSYKDMYKENKECESCEVKNLCYQCPAGNMATSGKLFRPDGMCKRIITLYSDINELMIENKFRRKLKTMADSAKSEGSVVFSRSLLHLILYYFEDEKAGVNEVKDLVSESGISHHHLLGYFGYMLDYANREDTKKQDCMTLKSIVNGALSVNREGGSKDIYRKLLESEGYPVLKADYDVPEDILYITLMHFLIMNTSESRKRQ